MKQEAKIVIGTQFGDEGKGLVTDWLCSEPNVKDIVVRFNGGQQAGHTVFHRGVKHIFSSYGSGTLKGVPTYIMEVCCIYLNTMQVEYDILCSKLMSTVPELYVHPKTMLTTPYDVAYNRIKERLNGHGSCGLGIAATMKRNAETPVKLYAVDLLYPEITRRKLESIRNYYIDLVFKESFIDVEDFIKESKGQEPDFFNIIENWNHLFKLADYHHLMDYEKLIFEGAQGILLDMEHGIFPNVTYSGTTSANALVMCQKLGIRPEIYYASRCYLTRHGAGWMPNEIKIDLENNSEEINVFNSWQKDFRTGEMDYDLLNYALQIDSIYSQVLDKHLVVTCLDQRPDFRFDWDKIKIPLVGRYESYGVSDKIKQI